MLCKAACEGLLIFADVAALGCCLIKHHLAQLWDTALDRRQAERMGSGRRHGSDALTCCLAACKLDSRIALEAV